jgi:hypothetical protein
MPRVQRVNFTLPATHYVSALTKLEQKAKIVHRGPAGKTRARIFRWEEQRIADVLVYTRMLDEEWAIAVIAASIIGRLRQGILMSSALFILTPGLLLMHCKENK